MSSRKAFKRVSCGRSGGELNCGRTRMLVLMRSRVELEVTEMESIQAWECGPRSSCPARRGVK